MNFYLKFMIAWSNISVHALNTVFALFEIIFTNSPPAPWLALPVCILFLIGYLGVAYLTHATQGIYSKFCFDFAFLRLPELTLFE